MTLFLQTAGVVLAAVVLGGIVAGRVSRAIVASSTAAVAAAVASVVFWAALWDAGEAFDEAYAENSQVAPEAAAVAGGIGLQLDVTFIDWARQQMSEGERYWLMPDGPGAASVVYQWLSYQAFPQLSAETEEQADWLIFYDAGPRPSYDRDRFGPLISFNRGFAIARRR